MLKTKKPKATSPPALSAIAISIKKPWLPPRLPGRDDFEHFFIADVFEVPGLSRARLFLLGAFEQFYVFFGHNGRALFLKHVDQSFNFLFHLAGGQTVPGGQIFVDHSHSPLGILLSDADE